jgi:hypothetical protein
LPPLGSEVPQGQKQLESHGAYFSCFLPSAAELDDAAAIAFGGPVDRDGSVFLHGLAFFGGFGAGGFAGFGFAVEGLRYGGWAAHLAEREDFNVKLAAFVPDG